MLASFYFVARKTLDSIAQILWSVATVYKCHISSKSLQQLLFTGMPRGGRGGDAAQWKETEVEPAGTDRHAQNTLLPRLSGAKIIGGSLNSTHLRLGCEKRIGQESFSNLLPGTGPTSFAACTHPASSSHHPWPCSLSLNDCEHNHHSSSTAKKPYLCRAYWAKDPVSHAEYDLTSSPDGPWRGWRGPWTGSRWTPSGYPPPHSSVSFQNVANPETKHAPSSPASLLKETVWPRAPPNFLRQFLRSGPKSLVEPLLLESQGEITWQIFHSKNLINF